MKDLLKIKERVDQKQKHLYDLFQKDEENYKLWDGEQQIFDDHKMAVNITGTEMVSLALRVQASLTRSRLQIQVLPPDRYPHPDASKMAEQEERMYYHALERADEKLGMIGEASLLSSMAWQATVLGRIAVRCLVYEDEDIIWDFLPLNPRFLTFSYDSKGLSWVNYETFRSTDSIKDEYREEVEDPGMGISMSEYWDREHCVRYLTKQEKVLKSYPNPFGVVPVILQPITVGPKAINQGGLKVTTWGQSIYDHVKKQFRALNQMRSIAATHAQLIAKAPFEVIYEDGQDPNIDEDHLEYYPGAMFKHPRSVTMSSMKVSDIPPSLPAMINELSIMIQRATYAELHPDKPPHSGSALRILGQDKQDVLTPRMEALNIAYTRICKMVKRQILTQGLTIPVRTVKNNNYEMYDMNPELLDNDFYVKAELIRQDVYDEVEAAQRAQMLMQNRLMSREDILERVMRDPDTPTQLAKLLIEEVEDATPEMKLKRAIKIYEERGMPEDAEMVKEQLAMLEIQKHQALMGAGMPQGEPQGGAAPPGNAPPGVTEGY